MFQLSRKIHQHLSQADNIVLVPHQNPDGDAIGSLSALAEYLGQMKKNVAIFSATKIPDNLTFIAHSHKADNDQSFLHEDNVDTIIVVDSGDLKYAGIYDYVQDHPATVINIDHHQTNIEYGHYNLVNRHASSTSEIIYDFFKANQIKLNQKMATALLTGIITDTGNFTNSATSVSAINAASQLLMHGANLNLINRKTLQQNTFPILKLWGVVLSRLEYYTEQDIVYTYLDQKDFKKYNTTDAQAEGISNFMNTIGGVKIGLFLRETSDGNIKGSLRTNNDDVDVAKIAKQLGGGGHKKAAGFCMAGTVAKVLDQVLKIA